jgi:hypothetical protein
VSAVGWIAVLGVGALVFGPLVKAAVLDLADLWERVRIPPWERDERAWTGEEGQRWLDEEE